MDLDHYQYQLDILLWIIVGPGLIMVISIYTKDASRLICYPILIANMIFGFMLLILALIVLIYKILMTDRSNIYYLHIANFATFSGSFMLNQFYSRFCERRDIVKDPRQLDDDPEEEEEAAREENPF